MKISELMTRDVKIASPEDTIRDAADVMASLDCGFLPVGENDRLVGTITDRDIVIRGVRAGKGPDTPVRDLMSGDVNYCYEDEEIEDVTANMADIQVRRLPVLGRDKRMVGVVALGDFAINPSTDDSAEQALTGISQPDGGRGVHAAK